MSRTPVWGEAAPGEPPGTVSGAYDVAVVGAGFTGLATAIELAERGCRVIVLEARAVGAGASGRTTAKVSLLQGTRLSALAERHPPEVVAQYVAGNRAGQEWLVARAAALGVEVQERTAYTYAADESQVAAAEGEQQAAEAAGLPVRWHRGDEPFPTLGAVALAGQVQFDPRRMLEALTAHVRGLGVPVVTGARLTGAFDEGDEVVTTAGTVAAGHVVLATGSPVLDRGAYFARIEAHRSYLTAFEGAPGVPDGMFLSAGSPGRSVRQVPREGGDLLLVGGNGHATGRADSEAALVADLTRWTQEHFPGARPVAAWSAQDFHAFDGQPHVGPLGPVSDRVLVATGYAKWGLTNSAAAAQLLAARITGEDLPPWEAAFRSWSVREVGGTGAALRGNAQVAATLVHDQVTLPREEEDAARPPEGSGIVARRGVTPVATSTVGGVTCALRGLCTHLGGVVRWNDFEQSWDCPLHGSRFAADGAVLEGPAREPLAGVPRDPDGAS